MTENVIFINYSLDSCVLIQEINNEKEIIKTGELNKLIKDIDDKKNILIIISSLIAYSNKLALPKKNKSIFKRNAKKVISQQNIINQNNSIFVENQKDEYLPYIISNHKKILEINEIFSLNEFENISVILEKNIGLNNNENWFILIKSSDEISICHNHSILQTNSSDLIQDLNVIIQQNGSPKNINWYSFDTSFNFQLILDDIEISKNITLAVKNVINKKISEFLLYDKRYLQINHLLNNNENLFSITENWRSINFLFISVIIFFSLIFQFSSMSSYKNQIEVRKKNILSYIFSQHDKVGSQMDLMDVSKAIKQSTHLPEINHINSLNLIGSILDVEGIKIKKMYLENNIVNITLSAISDNVISKMNNALQESSEIIYEIKSIENEENDNIKINLVFNLVGKN